MWASCFTDGVITPSPQALLPQCPCVALMSIFFAAFRSLSILRPHCGQLCIVSYISLSTTVPQSLHIFVVFFGSTNTTLQPIPFLIMMHTQIDPTLKRRDFFALIYSCPLTHAARFHPTAKAWGFPAHKRFKESLRSVFVLIL